MNIVKATSSFEAWLGGQTQVVQADLDLKHRQMAQALFPFFRATFYRWHQRWLTLCKDENEASKVLAVGDLHIENFGTWRDLEGRLIWGVNDFDEAWTLPYTVDLVRLAASVMATMPSADGSAISAKLACAHILGGYGAGLKAGGRPFVLGERHPTLSALAHGELRNPVSFWQRMHEAPELDAKHVPVDVVRSLKGMFPEPNTNFRLLHHVRGLGSLGHQRFTATAEHAGGMMAREAKALTPSACAWAEDAGDKPPVHYQQIVLTAVRCADPRLKLTKTWLYRRLAPDCSRIELSNLSRASDEARLLRAMGWETANIHLGSSPAKAILKDLHKRPANWLRLAARQMIKALAEDWREWKQAYEQTTAKATP